MSIPDPPSPCPKPRVATLQPGTLVVRFFDPIRGPWHAGRTWGPKHDCRFDHHPLPVGPSQPESVWYAAVGKDALLGAVAESFGNPPQQIDKNGGRHVCMAKVVKTGLTLLDLRRTGPRRLGLDQRIGTSTDYGQTQKWARAFYLDHAVPVGIIWQGRQAGTENIVLNDRAPMGHLKALLNLDISDPKVWPRIAAAAQECMITVIS